MDDTVVEVKEQKKFGSFRDKIKDPGFLVSKGRFIAISEQERNILFDERDNLLRAGQSGDSLEVVALTRNIGKLNKQVDEERRKLEKEHIKNLASAIFMAMSNHGYANIRAVGRNATYNAIKSITIASGYCKTKGIDVCFEVSFDEGNLGMLRNKHHVQSVTAMMFKLKGYKEWAAN